MHWFDRIEQNRKLVIGGIVVICLVMLAVTIRLDNIANDSYWHAKMGLDWLEEGLSPWRDHLSFTFYGEEVVPPFMFQALLGWLVQQLGLETGFEAYKLISFLSAFLLVLFFLRKLRVPAIIYCLVLPLAVASLQLRTLVRPELISYSFSILAIILYHKANNKISTANMLSILALLLVWNNYHTPIFGYVIFFGLFVDLGLEQIRQRAPRATWIKWLLWGIAVFVVGFLKPGFHHSAIGVFFFSEEWKVLISEYKSAHVYLKFPATYALIAVYSVTLLSLLRSRRFGLLFICLLLGYYSITMSRLVAQSSLVILCIFAWSLSEINLRDRLQRMPVTLSRATAVGVSLLFALSLVSPVLKARLYMDANRIPTLFPEDLVNYMIDNDIQGRIFNDHGAGGYLAFHLAPDSRVYIDGRTGILYPLDHLERYMTAAQSSSLLRDEIDKYDIELVVLKNHQHNFALARNTGKFELDYVGARFSLFTRGNSNFPVFGTLLASPACWSVDMIAELKSEQAMAKRILPRNSFLKPSLINLIIDYSEEPNKKGFLNDLQVTEYWSAPELRFSAYQALSEDLNLVAYSLFDKMDSLEFSDYLGAALTQARLGKWKRVEQILDNATRLAVSFESSEIKILHDLLVHVRQNSSLELFSDAYVDRLGNGITSENETVPRALPEISAFCPEI